MVVNDRGSLHNHEECIIRLSIGRVKVEGADFQTVDAYAYLGSFTMGGCVLEADCEMKINCLDFREGYLYKDGLRESKRIIVR